MTDGMNSSGATRRFRPPSWDTGERLRAVKRDALTTLADPYGARASISATRPFAPPSLEAGVRDAPQPGFAVHVREAKPDLELTPATEPVGTPDRVPVGLMIAAGAVGVGVALALALTL